MLVTLLVLTFLLGPIVLLFWLGSLPFLVLYTGLPILLIWVMMGSPFWNFLSFLSNGLVTDCLVKRLLDHMFGLVVLFWFPSVPVSEGIEIRHGCQFISSLVRALGKLPGGLGRFLPCQVGTHLSRLRHLGWNQCSHGLTSRPLESCHHRCLSAVCGLLGYPKGSAAELLDGVLKLRCCVTPFSQRFPSWSLPPVGNGRVRSLDVATGHLVGEGGNMVKRVRLTRKTHVVFHRFSIPDQGHSTPRRWKRLRPPSSEGVGGEAGVPRNLFPRIGVV